MNKGTVTYLSASGHKLTYGPASSQVRYTSRSGHRGAKCAGQLWAISRLMHRSINRIDLFDHIVGTSEDIWRDFEAEYLGGLKIDDEFEARRLFDW